MGARIWYQLKETKQKVLSQKKEDLVERLQGYFNNVWRVRTFFIEK